MSISGLLRLEKGEANENYLCARFICLHVGALWGKQRERPNMWHGSHVRRSYRHVQDGEAAVNKIKLTNHFDTIIKFAPLLRVRFFNKR